MTSSKVVTVKLKTIEKMKRLRIHTEEIMTIMGWSRKHTYKIMRTIRDCYPNSKKYVMLKDFADHIGTEEDYVQEAILPKIPNEDP
ncbi:MAG: hypothetical protein U5N85_22980 [Arcicella sp.]|nr:hypothetical protein [Arcicella sp.]